MKHKKYRLCLLSLLILAVVGGILYYNYGMSDKGLEKQAGTFVEKIISGCGRV